MPNLTWPRNPRKAVLPDPYSPKPKAKHDVARSGSLLLLRALVTSVAAIPAQWYQEGPSKVRDGGKDAHSAPGHGSVPFWEESVEKSHILASFTVCRSLFPSYINCPFVLTARPKPLRTESDDRTWPGRGCHFEVTSLSSDCWERVIQPLGRQGWEQTTLEAGGPDKRISACSRTNPWAPP
jgi:hypothetical protein